MCFQQKSDKTFNKSIHTPSQYNFPQDPQRIFPIALKISYKIFKKQIENTNLLKYTFAFLPLGEFCCQRPSWLP